MQVIQRLITVGMTAMIFPLAPVSLVAQQRLPYSAIDHPQFVRASQATYLSPNDLVLGVAHGKVAKAYPAAILAQHGVVQDRMPDGPIAVTW